MLIKSQLSVNEVDALEKTASDHGDDPGDRAEPECVTSSRKSQSKDNITKSGLLTDEKLHSIMSYLDEVDKAERLGELDHVSFLFICIYADNYTQDISGM